VVSADTGHVALIASRARRADRDELWAASRMTPAEALLYGMAEGNAFTGIVEGEPVCMFGIVRANVLGGLGVPWLVGTDGIERNARAFLRESRPVFDALRTGYHTLANHVDERNAVAHRWLRWLGFTLLQPEPHGPDGLPFRPFYWRREDV
jgi:hypothetical protein